MHFSRYKYVPEAPEVAKEANFGQGESKKYKIVDFEVMTIAMDKIHISRSGLCKA